MEQKIKNAVAVVLAATCLSPGCVSAKVSKKHDKEKFYQVRSMEDGKWGFGAGTWYWTWHNDYSGASWHWKFGFPPYEIKFKESESDTRRVGPSRAAQIPLEVAAMNRINVQIDSIQPLVVEETIRSAERMVDVTYAMYLDDFRDYDDNIRKALLYCIEHGDEGIRRACVKVQEEYDCVCSSIQYVHEQGPGNEMEPTKRQIAYEEARRRLGEILRTCRKLVRLTSTL